tara:strand:- start:39 stop:263 length:225 start_codon:yes stop_codon:yes gene_type:complete
MSATPEIDARIKQLEAEQKVLIRLLTEKKPAKAPTPKTPEPESEDEGNPLMFGLLLIVLASATPISVVILLTLI